MDPLPLSRNGDGTISFRGQGSVCLQVDYEDVTGTGGHGALFRGNISASDCGLLMQVAVKVLSIDEHTADDGPNHEAEIHAKAWDRLECVVKPIGYLRAHARSGTPAMLAMEVATPFTSFLDQAGPLDHRHFTWIKAITRIVFQILRFVVEADDINILHGDISLRNVYVTSAENLEYSTLAMGGFGVAQEGEEAENGVLYNAGVYTWDHTSPRMASLVYEQVTALKRPIRCLTLNKNTAFYNEIFGWARIAFIALADHPVPDPLYGPCPAHYERIPVLGYGDVLDSVRHLLSFALDILAVGSTHDEVDPEYIKRLEWYSRLSKILVSDDVG